MAQIIVDPKEQRAFARALANLSAEMKSQEAALNRELAQLGSTWKDDHYSRFTKATEEMSLYLLGFYKRAESYCNFLERKARAAERYLGL